MDARYQDQPKNRVEQPLPPSPERYACTTARHTSRKSPIEEPQLQSPLSREKQRIVNKLRSGSPDPFLECPFMCVARNRILSKRDSRQKTLDTQFINQCTKTHCPFSTKETEAIAVDKGSLKDHKVVCPSDDSPSLHRSYKLSKLNELRDIKPGHHHGAGDAAKVDVIYRNNQFKDTPSGANTKRVTGRTFTEPAQNIENPNCKIIKELSPLEQARESCRKIERQFSAKFFPQLQNNSDSESVAISCKSMISSMSGKDLRKIVHSHMVNQPKTLGQNVVFDVEGSLPFMRLSQKSRICACLNSNSKDKCTLNGEDPPKDMYRVASLQEVKDLTANDSLTAEDVLRNEVIGPIKRQMQRMYLDTLKNGNTILEDLERIPGLIKAAYDMGVESTKLKKP